MTRMTKSKTREIIDDFAKEIHDGKRRGRPPKKHVINFRNELRDGIERDVLYVPLELLRYRKDNGRISSNVSTYETNYGVLDETSDEAQKIIEDFLKEKDPEKTEELKRSIAHDGQRDPAIITCDGFLINGNRRKMVLERLVEPEPKTMRVVILPGKNDEGGPPTLFEIEQIENRYQLQSEGKAEYSNFDQAISMRKKEELGMSLESQLRDDPFYAELSTKEFKKEVKQFEEECIKPLDCIDRYLGYLKRKGLYDTISTGYGDREGRWQAFVDYYKSVYKNIVDERKRIKLGVNEEEIGKIEDVSFKIIRKREMPDLPKAHNIMRKMPKWISNKDSKKELLKLVDINLELQKKERLDADGNEHDERIIDKIWGQKHATVIIRQVKKAMHLYEHKKEREQPLDLLEAALRKLYHEDMDTASVNISEISKARQLTKEIVERAEELERELYRHEKSIKKLTQKNKR